LRPLPSSEKILAPDIAHRNLVSKRNKNVQESKVGKNEIVVRAGCFGVWWGLFAWA
jgi:hypothetical protein